VQVFRLQFMVTQIKVVIKLFKVKTLQDTRLRLSLYQIDQIYTSLRERKRRENGFAIIMERQNTVLTRMSPEHRKELSARQGLHGFVHFPPNRHSTLCLTLGLSHHQVTFRCLDRWPKSEAIPKYSRYNAGRIRRAS
jgi:hypothetical protein